MITIFMLSHKIKEKKMLDTPDFTNEFDQNDVSQNKVTAIIGYIPPLFFIQLITAKGSKYARFHANQGLILLIAYAAVSIVVGIISGIFTALGLSFIGSIFGLVEVVPALLMVFGIVQTAKNRSKELPVIGKFRILK